MKIKNNRNTYIRVIREAATKTESKINRYLEESYAIEILSQNVIINKDKPEIILRLLLFFEGIPSFYQLFLATL